MTRVTNPNKIKEILSDILIFIAGGALLSTAINCFLSDNDILFGGFTGIATILNYLIGFPIGTAIFIMNIPLFFLAYKKLGGTFIKRTILATLITSLMIDIGVFLPTYTNDRLLASIVGGALVGVGLGIVIIRHATTGGVDIMAELVNLKHPHISLGKIILIFDAVVVILGGFVYGNVESVLYAIVVSFVTSQVLDYIIFRHRKV